MLTVRIECERARITPLLEATARIANAIAELDGVSSVHIGVARLDVSSARTRETELRGSVPERAFDAAFLVDGSSRREIVAASGDILRILAASSWQPKAEEIAVYDLSYALDAKCEFQLTGL